MKNLLQLTYDPIDLRDTLLRCPRYWKKVSADMWHLCCGDYVIAAVWPCDDNTVTWRTMNCGAHNQASCPEEGMAWCDKTVKEDMAWCDKTVKEDMEECL